MIIYGHTRYRKNKAAINERINLTGLIPSKVVEHTLTNPPIKSQVLEFKQLFESRRGVYVVEFIGGGLSSRALIRIGALSLIRQVLSKGLLFHMIDEQKNVCRSEKTDILIGDKIFKPEPVLNWGILIPYTEQEINESAILRHEGFAELQNVVVPREEITFDMGLLFNEENLVSGAQLPLLLMPKLFVMGQDEKEIEVSNSRTITINRFRDRQIYYDYYLRQSGKNYILNFLGKNGEPLAKEKLNITFTQKYSSNTKEEAFETDSQGQVHLGDLKSVTAINWVCQEPVYSNFQIKCDTKIRSLPDSFDIAEGHESKEIWIQVHKASITQDLDTLRIKQGAEVFSLNSNSNVFLSEKSLSDEIKYVLERKRKNTFMGNTLDKPSSLLKRHFVRETVQDQEQLNVERDYGAARKPRATARSNLSAVGTRWATGTSYTVNSLNTFLGKEGWNLFNITPDANGMVEFELPENGCYGTLVIVVKDNKNSVLEVRSLEGIHPSLKSVTLAESKKANKVYMYERLAHKLSKGQACEIKDLAATELSLVEDVQTLFKMLKLISTNSQLDEWEFLAKWPTLSPEEQLKKYDKYISHELNLFAYFKDREFFELVVKPHILNKSSKQVIDYFLLGDEVQLKKYLNPICLNILNGLELALVVLFFRKSESAKTSEPKNELIQN